MNDYTSILTYEDACTALGESVNEPALAAAGATLQIIAQLKCELVAKAINGGKHIVFSGDITTYAPFFEEYASIQKICRYHSLWRNGEVYVAPMQKSDGADAFLCGCRVGVFDSDCEERAYPHRIIFESEGKAYHFGKYFMGLWAQAFLPDWNVDTSRITRIDVSKDAPEEKEAESSSTPPISGFAWGMVCGVISNLIFCLGMLLLRRI